MDNQGVAFRALAGVAFPRDSEELSLVYESNRQQVAAVYYELGGKCPPGSVRRCSD